MAPKNRSLSARITRWRVLFDNTREFLPEVPHLEGDLQELRGIADEVSALRAERMVQETKLREITLKIRKLARKGDSIRGRIGAGLKSRFGFGAVLLIQCGFTPRKQAIDRGPQLSAEAEARLDPRPSPPAPVDPMPLSPTLSPLGRGGTPPDQPGGEPDEDT